MSSSSQANRLLGKLSTADLGLLRPHLETVSLPRRKQLEEPNRPIRHAYFVDSGLVSVLANGAGDRRIEVGVIGREGMTGMPILMGTDRTPHETFVQVAATARRVPSADLAEALERSASLRRLLLNYAHAFAVQTAHTALANGRSKVEERLARWLLMAHDRMPGDELPLTHELLSVMLGVTRPGITVALQQLEVAGLILAKRGIITIRDRKGLEGHAKGAYGVPEAEFQRLFGSS